MALTTKNNARERILVYGQEGSGKTRTYWSIAKRMRQTKAPGKMYVVDLDFAADRFKDAYPDWEENMVVVAPKDFAGLVAVLDGFGKLATRDDWLVVDGLAEAWTGAKEHVIETAYGKDYSDYLVEGLKSAKSDFGRTPDAQNKTWRGVSRWFTVWPGHVLAASPAKSVFVDRDKGSTPGLESRYAGVGWQPDTQKMVGYAFHTVLYLADVGTMKDERWIATTVKDRERKKLVNKVVGDFCHDYLIEVGGWTL